MSVKDWRPSASTLVFTLDAIRQIEWTQAAFQGPDNNQSKQQLAEWIMSFLKSPKTHSHVDLLLEQLIQKIQVIACGCKS